MLDSVEVPLVADNESGLLCLLSMLGGGEGIESMNEATEVRAYLVLDGDLTGMSCNEGVARWP